MNAPSILAPIFALALWTGVVLLRMAFVRIRAMRRHIVTFEDFRFGEGANVPSEVAVANRNYMNLLKLPLLFYVVCIVAFVTSAVDVAIVTAAWLYVAARVAHSIVHLTSNDVIQRFVTFAASNLALGALWAMVGLRVLG